MGGVRVALGPDGPRGGVEVDAGVGHLRRIGDVGLVTAGIQGEAVGGGVHHQRVVLVTDGVGADRGLVAGHAHRGRHGPDDLTILLDDDLLGVVVGLGAEVVTDGEVRLTVLLAVHTVAEVLTEQVRLDVDLGARGPVVLRTPADLLGGDPVERTLDLRLGLDGDGVLDGLTVRRNLVEAQRDGLADADGGAVERGHRTVGEHVRAEAGEALVQLLLAGLRIQRVVAGVLEIAGGGPLGLVVVELALDLSAVTVGQGDGVDAVGVGDGDRLVDLHAGGVVLDARSKLTVDLRCGGGLRRSVFGVVVTVVVDGARGCRQKGDRACRSEDGPHGPHRTARKELHGSKTSLSSCGEGGQSAWWELSCPSLQSNSSHRTPADEPQTSVSRKCVPIVTGRANPPGRLRTPPDRQLSVRPPTHPA